MLSKNKINFLIIYNIIIFSIIVIFKFNIKYYYIFFTNILILFNLTNINNICYKPTITNPLMNYNSDINKLISCKYDKNILNKIEKYTDDAIFNKINDLNYKNKFNRFFYTKPNNSFFN